MCVILAYLKAREVYRLVMYNKVSVVANMNQITNLCPELLDDEKDIVNQNLIPINIIYLVGI